MSDYLTDDDLDVLALEEDDVELPDGRRVRVRGISHAEMIGALAFAAKGDDQGYNDALMSAGLVRPSWTREQAARWRATRGVLFVRPILTRIRQLSGLDSNIGAAYKSAGSEPGSSVAALPGGEVGDVDDPATPGGQ